MTEPTTQQPTIRPAGASYAVLKLNGPGWEAVGATTARSAEHAIKTLVAKLADGDQAGTYVAVPAKSWNPVVVTPKVERSLTVEEVPS